MYILSEDVVGKFFFFFVFFGFFDCFKPNLFKPALWCTIYGPKSHIIKEFFGCEMRSAVLERIIWPSHRQPIYCHCDQRTPVFIKISISFCCNIFLKATKRKDSTGLGKTFGKATRTEMVTCKQNMLMNTHTHTKAKKNTETDFEECFGLRDTNSWVHIVLTDAIF